MPVMRSNTMPAASLPYARRELEDAAKQRATFDLSQPHGERANVLRVKKSKHGTAEGP